MKKLELIALEGIPLIEEGDDLVEIILSAIKRNKICLSNGNVLVIAQKIVSKSEGRYASLNDIKPSQQAIDLSRETDKDPKLVQLILNESKEVVRYRKGVIAERIFSFDQARKEFIKSVTISVGSDFKELDSLTSQLKELSTNGSGSPIVISYSGNNAKADIQLPKELTVEVSDLSYRTLESICGKGNVDLVYYARPYIH